MPFSAVDVEVVGAVAFFSAVQPFRLPRGAAAGALVWARSEADETEHGSPPRTGEEAWMAIRGATIVAAGQGPAGRLGGMGVRFMVGGKDCGGGFALVEHPLGPRALEIISPAGFERYFEELVELFKGGRPEPGLLAEVAARYGLETDPGSIPTLTTEHGLSFGPAQPGGEPPQSRP